MRHGPINPRAVASLRSDAQVRRVLEAEAQKVVDRAQQLAPKRTGAGAASIHKEPIEEDGGIVGYSVSWDKEHDYMRFSEFGTEHKAARPFLRPAAPQ